MGGGLMQLVAYGAQDIYLTGNPQITFFKVVYRRHTNFSMETIVQTLNGTAAQGQTSTVTISRNGDLVYKVYVNSTKPGVKNGSNNIVDEVELEIGGQRIDKHYKEWMQTWNELSTPESKAIGLKAMQGDIGSSGDTGVKNLVQIPLQFWFCRNPGLALPLIALQYHEVKLKIKWGSDFANTSVNCDYIYLDTDERRRFAQVSHEYLIEQLQRETYTDGAGDKKLNFNHPVKELVWVNVTSGQSSIKYQLKLNGHDRFAEQEKEYFMLRQPLDYHTAIPGQNLPTLGRERASADQIEQISKGTLTHATSSTPGIDSVVCTTSSLSWVTIAGSTDSPASVATNAKLEVASGTAAPAFIVGALDAASSIRPGTLNIGDTHMIILNDNGVRTTEVFATVKFIFTNSETDTGALGKINGALGPVSSDLSALSSATGSAITLESAGATDDITDGVGGGILVVYDVPVNFGFTIHASQDTCQIIKVANAINACRTSKLTKEINVYSFALKPEEHQPSGTCNFSRIDNAQLTVTGADGGGNIYAVNYNVLRIMSGMGGLAYSN